MQPPSFQLRYVLPAAGFVLLIGVIAAVLNFSGGQAALDSELTEQFEPSIEDIITAEEATIESALPPDAATEVVQVALQAPAKPVLREEILVVSSGDTLMDMAVGAGAPGDQAYAAIAQLAEAFDPRRLQIGQEITVQLTETGDAVHLTGMGLRPDVASEVWVIANEDGDYEVAEFETELIVQYAAANGTIEGSLYQAATGAGVDDEVLLQLIRVYSYDIDFQRDIRRGDAFEVLFEREHRPDGSFARNRDVLRANLILRGVPHTFYRYETTDGVIDYFTAEGRSIRKALMRTPIDGARLSSSFGMRKHPVLGYSRMHRGVDFAAPTGTPIYAAGDGVVEVAGRNKGYGNYIRVRHNRVLKTAYAHMNGFADGISKGARVKQGQVIGYVGSTGLSTGPHLHYEVLKDGKQVNPMTVDMPAGPALEGAEFDSFREWATQLDLAYEFLSQPPEVAANE